LEATLARPPKRRGARGPALAGWGEPAERNYYPDFPVGAFQGDPLLRWVKPDIFRLEVEAGQPFQFIRKAGEVITPGAMLTDGGSIPRWAGLFSDKLSPWGYAPAFLIHDWLFDCHHAGTTDKRFEEVRDIMMEGVKTLMESGRCERSLVVFNLIYSGIDSPVARAIWNRKK
ncbi:MAG: DUF1353 domain-containing protein, partial [Thiobacillus sp.]|nr:DUF1353 domain-containing protein [Thiobacillus sp.]